MVIPAKDPEHSRTSRAPRLTELHIKSPLSSQETPHLFPCSPQASPSSAPGKAGSLQVEEHRRGTGTPHAPRAACSLTCSQSLLRPHWQSGLTQLRPFLALVICPQPQGSGVLPSKGAFSSVECAASLSSVLPAEGAAASEASPGGEENTPNKAGLLHICTERRLRI